MSESGEEGDEDSLLEVTTTYSSSSGPSSPLDQVGKDGWVDDAQDLSFEQVLFEERELLSQRLFQRGPSWASEGGAPFSVAFSGGGVRAAAFQAGVLWRLAEAGRLRDVEYLSAVSGGGYIAASYASHLLGAERPTDPSEVNGWFRAVVARTICRMQRNTGNFVRDCVAAPGTPTDGAGCCPRVCDLPLLLLVLAVTITTNPIFFLAVVLIPTIETIEIFFGPSMRNAFCADNVAGGNHITEPFNVLMEDGAFLSIMQALSYCSVVTFLVWVISKLPVASSRAAMARHPMRFLFTQSLLALFLRCTFALISFLTLLVGIPYIEWFKYETFKNSLASGPSRVHVCMEYMCTNGTARMSADPCGVLLNEQRPIDQPYCRRMPLVPLGRDAERRVAGGEWDGPAPFFLFSWVGFAMLVAVLASIVLLPCFPWLLENVVLWLGPIMLVVACFGLLLFRVFAPMTGQKLMEAVPYEGWWVNFVRWAMGVGLIAAFGSDHAHGLWHFYYRRCLRTNFFDGGIDRTCDELRTDVCCPLVIMTGTVNDFMRPSDKRSISEISLSPLHTGSVKCGYVRTLPFRSLAQLTALTGAGCLDALTLSMSSKIRSRFWFEVLNLGWGDFILFQPSPRLLRLALRASRNMASEVYWHLHRAPTTVLWLFACVGFAAGWQLLRYPSEANCRRGRNMLLGSIAMAVAMMALSFFSFLDCLSWLMYSPLIRRLQEATRFYFRGLKPPGMLYVTDGGVQDCTALHQLMRRRCERILLVLAAADPCDDLGVLRTTMDIAVASKTGCFYDPRDPRRNVKILLDEFKKDLSMPYLHLGIRYGWDGPIESVRYGRLIIVKNRLQEGFGHRPVRPLLTEEEVRDGAAAGPRPPGGAWGGALEEDLGGLGCCDCCHTHCGNCGRKFPHLSFTGYMYLTPQLFSSLCRLGHDVSEAAVLAATSPDMDP